jgi:hypothetical protein
MRSLNVLEEIKIESWEEPIEEKRQKEAIESLEAGKILFLPSLAFVLTPEEKRFFASEKVDPKRKNISYDMRCDECGGSLWEGEEALQLKEMLKRYAVASKGLIQRLFPYYVEQLSQARTSFRVTEISGRKCSLRKDDRRLHVDAFPSKPTQGRRILRLFTNVNPEGKPRVWRVGEPFEEMAKKFICKISPPLSGSAFLLHVLKITKERRTPYDHYMLQLHNKMKEDEQYQLSVAQERIEFPAGSSWIAFSDQVLHAATDGWGMFEQTFSLPVGAMKNPSKAPLAILERQLNRCLR